MIKKIYSIRDTKAEVFHLPFYQNTHGEAERSFTETANDPKGAISRYPEDFDLYYLGEYDDQDGSLKVKETPEHMVKAIHCVKKNTMPMAPEGLATLKGVEKPSEMNQ